MTGEDRTRDPQSPQVTVRTPGSCDRCYFQRQCREALLMPWMPLPLRCSPTLDRRILAFSGLVMATGWLRRRDNAARSGQCIRWRCGVGGMPVVMDGETVGAIGISGGSVAQDVEIAAAALAAFAARMT